MERIVLCWVLISRPATSSLPTDDSPSTSPSEPLAAFLPAGQLPVASSAQAAPLSLAAFLRGGQLPVASSAQAAPLVKGKVFLRYVAKLTPTRENGTVVGDLGATGLSIILGVKASESDSYVVINALVNNIKSGGAMPHMSYFKSCLAGKYKETFDGNFWGNTTSARGGKPNRYSFKSSYVIGPVAEADAREIIGYQIGKASGLYTVVTHPKSNYALCGRMKQQPVEA
ncbi:unnamed protein product [Closterium sp. Naga37s-1]|nr:unnamed protein product [Closterium sp. Naga37s-1]